VLAAVAVNVTGMAAQTVPAGLAAKITAGVRFGFTVMLMAFELAVVDVKQLPPLILISQVTILPFDKLEEVNVLAALFCTWLPLT